MLLISCTLETWEIRGGGGCSAAYVLHTGDMGDKGGGGVVLLISRTLEMWEIKGGGGV